MKYYAHSLGNEPREKWQLLEDHMMNVADLASEFAKPFQSETWAWNAGLLHDLGKADGIFQKYLLRQNGLDDPDYDSFMSGRVNHSSAGAAFAEDKYGSQIGRTLAYLVAGHHAGLPDYYPADTGNAALQIRLQDGRANLNRISDSIGQFTDRIKTASRPPAFVKQNNFHLWVRMLYSCLVDADFLDTEAFMNTDQAEMRKGFESLQELRNKFNVFMNGLVSEAKPSEVNIARAEILSACHEAANHKPGLFTLTVPTGGGKTLSSMAFALDHAVLYNKSRIIYVIPYTSIIEQTAKIFSGIFGADNVVEHHSNISPEKETPRSSLAAENWDAPIIVTTNVQFFESLYAAKSSRCRKLHNIIQSVVILDEAQLLPPERLTPCVNSINLLTRPDGYGVTMVLCTATQPELPEIDCAQEIIPQEADLYNRLKRVEYKIPANLNEPGSWESIASQLKRYDQVLCVVNTRRDCFDLFSLMPEGTIHLSGLMCGAHKSEIIDKIKKRLARGNTCRVISTQLVEAGVDIDFPVVYRALARMDSIAQAAGRCNREGSLNDIGRLGEVHIFQPPKPCPRGLLRKGEDTTVGMFACGIHDLQQPVVYRKFFEAFYAKVNDTGKNWLNEQLIKDAPEAVCFRTAGKDFQMIDDQTQRSVIVSYGESPELIHKMRFAGPTREIMRKLQRYTVNLSVWLVGKMLEDGRLEEIDKEKAPGIIAQSCLNLYSAVTGLDIYKEQLPEEDLIV